MYVLADAACGGAGDVGGLIHSNAPTSTEALRVRPCATAYTQRFLSSVLGAGISPRDDASFEMLVHGLGAQMRSRVASMWRATEQSDIRQGTGIKVSGRIWQVDENERRPADQLEVCLDYAKFRVGLVREGLDMRLGTASFVGPRHLQYICLH